MATLLPAIMLKYDSLTASGFAGSVVPPIFHDTAPQVVSGQVRPPYTVVSWASGQEDLTFEDDDTESSKITFTVFCTDEGDLTRAVSAIRFNNLPKSQNAGFDSGSLPSLTDGTLVQMVIANSPVNALDSSDKDGKNVYRATLEYDVMVERS